MKINDGDRKMGTPKRNEESTRHDRVAPEGDVVLGADGAALAGECQVLVRGPRDRDRDRDRGGGHPPPHPRLGCVGRKAPDPEPRPQPRGRHRTLGLTEIGHVDFVFRLSVAPGARGGGGYVFVPSSFFLFTARPGQNPTSGKGSQV